MTWVPLEGVVLPALPFLGQVSPAGKFPAWCAGNVGSGSPTVVPKGGLRVCVCVCVGLLFARQHSVASALSIWSPCCLCLVQRREHTRGPHLVSYGCLTGLKQWTEQERGHTTRCQIIFPGAQRELVEKQLLPCSASPLQPDRARMKGALNGFQRRRTVVSHLQGALEPGSHGPVLGVNVIWGETSGIADGASEWVRSCCC